MTAPTPRPVQPGHHDCGGVSFRNPILTASGTFGYGKEFENLTDLGAIGGLVTKGISPAPRFGNATPRICETASGMLNSIGLENVGVEGFAGDKLPYLRTLRHARAGELLRRHLRRVRRLRRAARPPGRRRRAGDERLLPQHQGGRHRVRDRPARARRSGAAVPRRRSRSRSGSSSRPTPSDIVALAKACADNGADGLSIINTITGMAIDARTRRPKIATIFGGLSGPGHQADRAAHGVPGAARRRAAAHLGHRRDPGRDRRDRVLPRGRQHRPGRDAELRGSRRVRPHRARPGNAAARRTASATFGS